MACIIYISILWWTNRSAQALVFSNIVEGLKEYISTYTVFQEVICK